MDRVQTPAFAGSPHVARGAKMEVEEVVEGAQEWVEVWKEVWNVGVV